MNNVRTLEQNLSLPEDVKFILFKSAYLVQTKKIIGGPIHIKQHLIFCFNNLYVNDCELHLK